MKVLHKDNIAEFADGDTVMVPNPKNGELVGCTFSVKLGFTYWLTTMDSRVPEFRRTDMDPDKYSKYIRHLRVGGKDGDCCFTAEELAKVLEEKKYIFA